MTLNSYIDIYVIEEYSKQVQHEYLVEIVDKIGKDKTDNKLDLTHSVKVSIDKHYSD